MGNLFKGSPCRCCRYQEEEAGGNRPTDVDHESPDDDDDSSPFDHDLPSTTNASMDRLRRWRQAALVLNASRRFRYTLDLKREEEKRQMKTKIRAHAQATRASCDRECSTHFWPELTGSQGSHGPMADYKLKDGKPRADRRATGYHDPESDQATRKAA